MRRLKNTFVGLIVWKAQTTVCYSDLRSATLLMRTDHGVVLLFECGGVDDASQEASVADGVLLSLVALVQQLVVQQEQLAPQHVELVRWSRP